MVSLAARRTTRTFRPVCLLVCSASFSDSAVSFLVELLPRDLNLVNVAHQHLLGFVEGFNLHARQRIPFTLFLLIFLQTILSHLGLSRSSQCAGGQCTLTPARTGEVIGMGVLVFTIEAYSAAATGSLIKSGGSLRAIRIAWVTGRRYSPRSAFPLASLVVPSPRVLPDPQDCAGNTILPKWKKSTLISCHPGRRPS